MEILLLQPLINFATTFYKFTSSDLTTTYSLSVLCFRTIRCQFSKWYEKYYKWIKPDNFISLLLWKVAHCSSLSKKMAQFHVYCVMGNLQKLHQREPNISIHVSHTFPLVLTRRNCFKMKSILQGWSIP